LGAREGSCQTLEYYGTVSAIENEEPNPKNLGECTKDNPIRTSNPIHIATGNKHQKAADYPAYGASPLNFTRHYNSHNNTQTGLGMGWTHTYSRRVESSADKAWVFRYDGKVLNFTNQAGTWQGDPDISGSLEQIATGWRYKTNREIEDYDSQGRLVSISALTGDLPQHLSYNDKGQLIKVSGPFQRTFDFNYDNTTSMLTSVDTPDGALTYTYDAVGNLVTAVYPDGSHSTYHYNEPAHTSGADLPHALTGITDERGIRYGTYKYDSAGLAIASYHGSETDIVTDRIDGLTIDRDANGTHTITNSQGATTTYKTESVWDTELVTSITGPACSSCGSSNTTYLRDPINNNLLQRTKNGVLTEYGNYDSHGNPAYETEAAGTPDARTTTTEWHPDFNKPVRITEPGRIIEYTYDTQGRLLNKKVSPAL
jgi:YD repeat-containing protein